MILLTSTVILFLLCFLCPQLRGWGDVVSLWLEAGSTLCALVLNYSPNNEDAWQQARLSLSLAALLMQVLVVSGCKYGM